MKTITKNILIILLVNIITYLTYSFCNWELNLANWESVTRVLAVTMSIFASIMILVKPQ